MNRVLHVASALWLAACTGLAQGRRATPRESALDELAEELVGPSESKVERLADAARHGDPPLRGESLWELAQLGHEAAVPALIGLARQAEPEVQPFCAMALGHLGGKAAAAAAELMPWLASTNRFTHSTAVWALGRIGAVGAVEQLRTFAAQPSDDELLSFLVREALARLETRERLETKPLRRGLAGATILHVADMDADASAFLFADALAGLDVKWEAVTVGPYNPTMHKLGGMSAAAEASLAKSLGFREDGTPQVDLVLISNVYPYELSPELRWRLWNYVRRGGRLIVGSLLVQPADSGVGLRKTQLRWRASLFDSALPPEIRVDDWPFLDGVAAPSRDNLFGVAETGRGGAMVVGFPCTVGEVRRLTLAELVRTETRTWRHLVREWGIGGRDKARDPLLWRQVFQYMLEGPASPASGVADAGRNALRQRLAAQAAAAARLPLDVAVGAPSVFVPAAPRATVRVTLRNPDARTFGPLRLQVSLADPRGRALLLQARGVRAPGRGEAAEAFEFVVPGEWPAGYFEWRAEVLDDAGTRVGRGAAPFARVAPWRFRQALVALPWGFGPLPPEAAFESLRSVHLSHFGLPPERGQWTWAVESPGFVPRGLWPGELLAGVEGSEWRAIGRALARHPFATCLDTVEEADLQVGTKLLHYGDVEREGHEQYRIYLKRKYRTLAALNEAWKSDFADWSEIRLLGAVALPGDHVSYTERMGGTSGQMVPVPAALDPARGIVSLAPYEDQNAWRWQYLWELLEIRHFAFHETDPYHLLQPGGHMGLAAPFDVPHTRAYAGNSLSAVGYRATLGRETYGLTPQVVLIGLAAEAAANSKMIWSALAHGGRLLTFYAPGDRYGVALMKGDHTLTEAGKTLGPILGPIMDAQEVLLATRNAVSRDVLFYSAGTNPYGSPLTVELYDALLWSGIQTDYGADLTGRSLVLCGSPAMPEPDLRRLRACVEAGADVVFLGTTGDAVLEAFGLRAWLATPQSGKTTEVVVDASLAGPRGDRLASSGHRALAAPDGWTVLGRHRAGGAPAILQQSLGQGRVTWLNFDCRYSASVDLALEGTTINDDNEEVRTRAQDVLGERYRIGSGVWRQAECYRRLLAGLAEQAGVTGTCRVVTSLGDALPFVDAELVETADRSQRYVVAYSDHRLPSNAAMAPGALQVRLPDVVGVHDVLGGSDLALSNGVAPLQLGPGQGTVLALLTEAPGAFTLQPECAQFAPGAPVRIRAEIRRADGRPSACEHAVQVRVTAPDGREIEALAVHQSVRGADVIHLWPAWDDPDGEWVVRATDLTTGRRAECRVTKAAAAPTPPAAPTPGFTPAGAGLTLEPVGAVAFDGFLSFDECRIRLCSAAAAPVRLKVALEIPARCLLTGPRERAVELTLAKPEAEVAWELVARREDALALYYSGLPAAFQCGGFEPAAALLRGQNLPRVRIEVAEGGPLTFRATDGDPQAAGKSFVWRVPVRVNPFTRQPVPVGPQTAAPLRVPVCNGLGRAIGGRLTLEWPPDLQRPAETARLAVPAGATQEVVVALQPLAGRGVEPGLRAVRVAAQAEGWEGAPDTLWLEAIVEREWRVLKGLAVDVLSVQELPVAPDGKPKDPQAWKQVRGDAEVPLSEVVAAPGEVAYALADLDSPAAAEVDLEVRLTGAEGRAWINGQLAWVSDGLRAKGLEGAGAALELELATLRRGPNTLLLEVQRTGRRFLDPIVTVKAKGGAALRDLVFRAAP